MTHPATCTYCGNHYDRPSVGFCCESHAEIQRTWLGAPGYKAWNEMQAVQTYLYLWDHRDADPENVRAPDHGAAYREWMKSFEEA